MAGGQAQADGDGWVVCAGGHRHWGRFGAAGLLPFVRGETGTEVLLQHRATWSHFGGTWGLLGGARHSAESPVTAALRETTEESDLPVAALQVSGRFRDDHGGWAYDTVLAVAATRLPAAPAGGESAAVAWVPAAEVATMTLHPGFAATWPRLRSALAQVTLVVDVANVMGSRPDGWWRDRAGAARRLLAGLRGLAATGLPGAALSQAWPGAATAGLTTWHPRVVAVLEGSAREAAADTAGGVAGWAGGLVSAVPASYGDDAVVSAVASAVTDVVATVGARPAPSGDDSPGWGASPVVVVTADRVLRERCAARGARVVGPAWLLRVLPAGPQLPA